MLELYVLRYRDRQSVVCDAMIKASWRKTKAIKAKTMLTTLGIDDYRAVFLCNGWLIALLTSILNRESLALFDNDIHIAYVCLNSLSLSIGLGPCCLGFWYHMRSQAVKDYCSLTMHSNAKRQHNSANHCDDQATYDSLFHFAASLLMYR